MKLLIFTNKFDENDDLLGFFVGWVNELSKYAEKLTVITQESGEYVHLPNLNVISLEKKKNKSRIKRFFAYNNLLLNLRNNYDSVFVVMAPGWVLGSVLAKILGKKIYLWYAVWKGSFKLKLAEMVADKIFCSVRESFPFETRKLNPIGQGIDTEYFVPDGNKRQEYKLLFLGRISPVKKIEILFQALAELKKNNNSIFEKLNLDIVGGTTSRKDEKYLADLKKISEKLELSDKINWLGRIPHPKILDYYQKSDVFINLTPAGSFDKTILEAMSCENMVLVSNRAMAGFLGDDLKSKILFEENNHLDLAKKLENLLELNSEEKNKIRLALREIILKHHSQKQWAKNFMGEMG